MATVTQRAGRWQARVRRRGARPRCRTFATREAAEAWAAKLEERVDAGNRTLAAAIDDYLEDPRREISAERRRVLTWWRKRLGKRRLDTLRRSHFLAARDELLRMRGRRGGTLAPATANWRCAAISAVLSEELLRDRIPSNPARIPRLRVRNAVDRTLAVEELTRLLEACAASRQPALLPLVVTALASGCRAGELCAFRWRDLDLDAGTARVHRSKSGRPRTVPITGATTLLRLRRESAERDESWTEERHVFAGVRGGAPFRYEASWTAARRAADLLDVRLHDLRHTFATALAEEGANLLAIAAALGHADVRTSQRYAHLAEAGVVELGDRAARRLLAGTTGSREAGR